jgi:uncharacterized protein (TIGR00730 family)
MHIQVDRHNGTATQVVPRPITLPRTVCVFGGAQRGLDPRLGEAAGRLGAALARAEVALVYGGGATGLMGMVAQASALGGGHVIAIVPRFLAERIEPLHAHHQLIITPDMHVRKRMMFDYADAFVALPGGIGTIEEMAEVITWAKLGQHRKPLLLADFHGFWSPWLTLLGHLERAGFLNEAVLAGCLVADMPEAVLPLLGEAAV